MKRLDKPIITLIVLITAMVSAALVANLAVTRFNNEKIHNDLIKFVFTFIKIIFYYFIYHLPTINLIVIRYIIFFKTRLRI